MLNVFDSLKSNIKNQSSFDVAQKMGLPHLKDELWKYTRAKKFLSEEFMLYSEAVRQPELDAVVARYSDANLVVFINGRFADSVSNFKDEALKVSYEVGLTADSFHHFFSAINHSFSTQGVTLRVEKNQKLKYPVRMLYISDKMEKDVFAPVSNSIVLEQGAEAVVIEHIEALSENTNFLSLRNSFVVNENAFLKHYIIQNDSNSSKVMSDLNVDVKADAKYEDYVLSLGSKISRFDLTVNMQGSGSEALFDCFYGVRDGQHTDHHTKVNHLVPHTSSKQIYKGILDGKARAVFNGKVIIVQDAQKTDAEQLNKNLMLTDSAEIDTKPEMMIDADDVKCAHGAAIGQMSEDEVFYLKSRGIGDKEARSLLARGYALESAARISDKSVKSEVYSLIGQYLGN